MDEYFKYNTLNSSRRYLKHWQEIHTNCNLLFPLLIQSESPPKSWERTNGQLHRCSGMHSHTSTIFKLSSKFTHAILNWLEFWQVSRSCPMLSSQPAASSDSRDGSWMWPALAVSGTRQQAAHKPENLAAPCLKTALLNYQHWVTILQYIPKTIKKSVC